MGTQPCFQVFTVFKTHGQPDYSKSVNQCFLNNIQLFVYDPCDKNNHWKGTTEAQKALCKSACKWVGPEEDLVIGQAATGEESIEGRDFWRLDKTKSNKSASHIY